ncbi:MAG: ATP-binding cassette domain-containing protein [Fimbriimonadaceae bacterium]|nr:ATP-binding cassette domain-containing protein [Fimbriimonadaceae bacterium]
MSLIATGLSKAFGPVQALVDVSATFSPGEIHAVLGENGAGKSTMMNLLAGFMQPDAGRIALDDKEIAYGRPDRCKKAGIAMVHQHFTLVPEFTVAENLVLAELDTFRGLVNVHQRANKPLQLAAKLGWVLDPRTKVRALPVGTQQRIEIVKALDSSAQAIIFDEPTATLSQEEVEDLFRVLRELKAEGKIIILIAHKLSEVMAIADRVTVLRKGRFVATAPIEEVTPTKLAEWMVGELPAELNKEGKAGQGPGLTVTDLIVKGDRGEQAIKSLALSVDKGTILGIGGVDGNGQVELAEALAQVRPIRGGVVHWEGQESWPKRIAYIPQDRRRDGIAPTMTIRENMLMTGHRRAAFRVGPLLKSGPIREWSEALVKRFQIKAESSSDLAGSLSGGNQQKVVVSRSLDETPELIVAVNPTRGLDIQATDYVHRTILEAAKAGAAVVLISTDLDELAALADRTVFLSRGQLAEGEGAEALVGGSS